jgi:4-hydroxyphenylacetate 3-monooxygenase
MSRGIYVATPSHALANHQSTVRIAAKMKHLLAVASLVTRATGARDIPLVRETLGRLAAMEAGLAGLVEAQVAGGHEVDNGYWLYNRRYLYSALHWMMENHSAVQDIIRELMGGGIFQMPASIDVMRDPALRAEFETYWTTKSDGAVQRMKLFKYAWDLIGSELASRAASYEKFFIGPTFSVRNYNFVNAPWDELHAYVEGMMGRYGAPGETKAP